MYEAAEPVVIEKIKVFDARHWEMNEWVNEWMIWNNNLLDFYRVLATVNHVFLIKIK
jgi:hypothetical protein